MVDPKHRDPADHGRNRDRDEVLLYIGGLKRARYLEALAGSDICLGYGAGHGTAIAPNRFRKA